MPRLRFRSLRWRFAALGILTFLPIVGLLVSLAAEERDQLVRAARDRAQAAAQIASQEHNDLFRQSATLLRFAARMPEMRGDAASCTAYLEGMGAPEPWVVSFFVSLPNGDTVCDNLPGVVIPSVAERAYFQEALRKRDLTYSGYLRGRLSGRPLIFAALPILVGGKIERVVTLSIDANALGDSLRLAAAGNDMLLTMLDRDGIVIARHPNDSEIVGRGFSSHPLIKTVLGVQEGILEAKDLRGVDRILAWQRVSANDAIMLVGVAREPIEQQVRARLRSRSMWAAGIIFASVLVGLVGAEAALFRPIDALTRLAHRYGRGDLADDGRHIGGESEIGTLDRSMRGMAAELAVQREALQEASQYKSEFLRNVSHELRSPLTAIIGYSDLLQAGVAEDDAPLRSEWAGTIRSSSGHLLELINDLLDLSKIEAGKLEVQHEPFDLVACARSAKVMLAPNAASVGIDLQFEPGAARSLVVVGDELRSKQVTINLLSNALKYTPANGRVALRLGTEGDDAILTVEDSGVGIAEADLPRVLEAFGQVDNPQNRTFNGTGLGLPLSVRLVELQGGRLSIASTPGQGTTVTVRLRLAPYDPRFETIAT
jgi:signal transduction histidine kinase